MKEIDIALVSVGGTIKCGLYENKQLFEEMVSKDLTLTALPKIFESLLPNPKQDSKYADMRINTIYYANGPGSFSALKLTHIFLHTLSLLYEVKLLATSSFYFTQAKYIKAFGTTYFYEDENNDIALAYGVDSPQESEFYLPKILDTFRFHHKIEPLYILPPVQS